MRLFNLFKKKKVKLTEADLKWNKIWELWVNEQAASPFAEIMTYQSEVNNGGHGQYFSNVSDTADIGKEMAVLENALPEELKLNLKTAYDAYLILEAQEYNEQAEITLEHCDSMFYEHEEKINTMLKAYAATVEL